MDVINDILCRYVTFYIILNIAIISFIFIFLDDFITPIIIGIALLIYNIHAIQTTKQILRVKRGKPAKY